MTRLDARNVPFDTVQLRDVDLIIAASGYESRWSNVLRRIREATTYPAEPIASKLVLLRFPAVDGSHGRDAEVLDAIGKPRLTLEVTKESGSKVLREIEDLIRTERLRRVLIDYSSMSRGLYLPLLSLSAIGGVRLTMCYSVGQYGAAEGAYPVSAIGKIEPVATMEGLPYATRPRLYVFGLGYDGTGTAALADRLEAGKLAVFWAEPGASERSAEVARGRNRELIERAFLRFRSPLSDVEGTTTALFRLAEELRETDKVVMVPVGPKPHVLACGIVAAQLDHVTVLSPYQGSGGIQGNFPDIAASGEVICTAVFADRRAE